MGWLYRLLAFVFHSGGIAFALAAPASAASWNANQEMPAPVAGVKVTIGASVSVSSGWDFPSRIVDGVANRSAVASNPNGYGAMVGAFFAVAQDIRRIVMVQDDTGGDMNAVAVVYADSDVSASGAGYTVAGVYPAFYGTTVIDIPSQGAHRGWWLVGRGRTGYALSPPYSNSTWVVDELEMQAGVATPSPSPSSSASATPTPAPSASSAATPTPAPSASASAGATPTPAPSVAASSAPSDSGTPMGLSVEQATGLLSAVDPMVNMSLFVCGFVGLRRWFRGR